MTKNLHRYVSELFNGKALGPMPVQEFLDTFLPPREDQHLHEANFFADLPQKGLVDKTRLIEKVGSFSLYMYRRTEFFIHRLSSVATYKR